MREFTKSATEVFTFGLRVDVKNPTNARGLVECVNHKPTQYGLRSIDRPTSPFSQSTFTAAGVVQSFPFPQLFRGETKTFLLDETQLFDVTEIGSDWALTAVTLYDAYDINTTTTIPSGGESWHFLDLGTSYMFFNGVCVIFRTNQHSIFGVADKTFVATTPTIKTGCVFNGRGVFGGFNTNDFWNDDWQVFWENNVNTNAHGIKADLSIKNNSVMWTSMRGNDLLWLFYQELAINGYLQPEQAYGESNPMIWDTLKGNEWGWKPMGWQGDVHKVLKLSNFIISYGSNGISALPNITDPYDTFGERKIADFGIASRSAAFGDENEHIIIDESGSLHKIDANLKMTELGFNEFFSPMLGNDIVISRRPKAQRGENGHEYYISDDTECFILTKEGLGESRTLFTSVDFAAGGAVGIFNLAVVEDTSLLLVSEVLNFGASGSSMFISSIEIGVDDSNKDISIALDYSSTSGSTAFDRTDFVDVDQFGVCNVRASGVEFRIVIKSANYRNVVLDDVKVNIQFDDKRNVRSSRGETNVR